MPSIYCDRECHWVPVEVCLFACPIRRKRRCAEYTKNYDMLCSYKASDKMLAKYGEPVLPIPYKYTKGRSERAVLSPAAPPDTVTEQEVREVVKEVKRTRQRKPKEPAPPPPSEQPKKKRKSTPEKPAPAQPEPAKRKRRGKPEKPAPAPPAEKPKKTRKKRTKK